MAGSSNIKQWNPGANNQDTDAEWLVDAQRLAGASLGELFPSKTGNKLFYQVSTVIAALAQALSDKGFTVSDADLTALTAVMANIRTADVGIRDTFRNLVVQNNATHPTYQVDLTCDEAILENSSGQAVRVSGVSVTYDITIDLDGGTETNSVWYYLWLFAKADGSYTYKLSLDSASPTLPSGYTFKALAGAVYNDASGDFVGISQRGDRVKIVSAAALTSGTNTNYTLVSLASLIPPTARILHGYGQSYQTVETATTEGFIAATSGGQNELKIGGAIGGAYGSFYAPYELPLASQAFYYKVFFPGPTGGWLSIYVAGWSY